MPDTHHSSFPNLRNQTYKTIIHLALPLVLSNSGLVLMQFVDGLFLSWYSPSALAAAGSAGIAGGLLLSVFLGTAGYASAFAAQFMGAGQPHKIGPVVWQGIYLSLVAGVVVAGIGSFGNRLFLLIGHEAELAAMEAQYFRIICLGATASLLSNALSTFFTGRGDTRNLMIVQLCGTLLNGILDYALIFGHWGFPRMGVAGAAIATVASQAAITLILGGLFLGRSRFRREFASWEGRRFDPALFEQLIRRGLPSGFRFFVEMFAWVCFIFFVGRIGTIELAATTIAWRFNGFAFFPIIGLSQAVGILVGHSQGRRRPDLSVKVTGAGMVIGEVWMLVWAALFLIIPGPLYGLFAGETGDAAQYAAIAELGVVFMRFVALYCSLDACNMIYVAALQYAGDTRWTFGASLVLHGIFVAALTVADRMRAGVIAEWAIATTFVMGLAFVWIVRFYRGKWKTMRLVDTQPEIALAE